MTYLSQLSIASQGGLLFCLFHCLLVIHDSHCWWLLHVCSEYLREVLQVLMFLLLPAEDFHSAIFRFIIRVSLPLLALSVCVKHVVTLFAFAVFVWRIVCVIRHFFIGIILTDYAQCAAYKWFITKARNDSVQQICLSEDDEWHEWRISAETWLCKLSFFTNVVVMIEALQCVCSGGAGEWDSDTDHSSSVESRLCQSDHHVAGNWLSF